LRKKDTEQALLFEEKITLQMRLLQAANIWNGNENETEKIEKLEKESADYTRLLHNEGTDTTQLWQEASITYYFRNHHQNFNFCRFISRFDV